MKKILRIVMLAIILTVPTIVITNLTIKEVEAGTWKKNSTGWWYQEDDNTYPINTWQRINSKWYYFNSYGYMSTGWIQEDNVWYYLNTSGAMTTGWVKLGENWYYMNPSGAMTTGWIKSANTWYYMNPSGAMAKGWIEDDGIWYHLNSSGAMNINKWVGDYYLGGSGAMAKNQWIGSYYVGAEGKWIPDYGLSTEEAAANEIVRLVNVERAKVGAKPLKMKKSLKAAAQIRVMEIRQSFSHTRPNGTSYRTLTADARRENIATNRDAAGVVQAWMNSPVHRESMLDGSFGSIGVAVYGDYGYYCYFVQLFGY